MAERGGDGERFIFLNFLPKISNKYCSRRSLCQRARARARSRVLIIAAFIFKVYTARTSRNIPLYRTGLSSFSPRNLQPQGGGCALDSHPRACNSCPLGESFVVSLRPLRFCAFFFRFFFSHSPVALSVHVRGNLDGKCMYAAG